MKVLFHTTSSNNINNAINSLKSVGLVGVQEMHYDQKHIQAVPLVLQKRPDLLDSVRRGDFREIPELQREAVNCDNEMLIAAKVFKPDLQIYISAWEGAFVPSMETLGELNSIAPLVHMCFDSSDPPWWPQMLQFEKRGVFSLTWNIDGGLLWPGAWTHPPSAISVHGNWQKIEPFKIKGVTTLTPVDPRYFDGRILPMDFDARPVSVGYAGNGGGVFRQPLIGALSEEIKSFVNRGYSDSGESYREYIWFLQNSKVTLSTPFTGSGASVHVKGKLCEGGLAGCCVLERRNPAVDYYFYPRFHYWPYTSIEDCIEQARYLISRPRLCEEIGANLKHEIEYRHSAGMIWGQVFRALGLNVEVRDGELRIAA